MKKASRGTMLVGTLASPLVMGAVVFLPAGRLDYWQGWVYVGFSLLVLAANFILLRDRPDLMQERLAPGQGTKGWDKAYYAVSTPLFLVSLVLAALDAGRFSWGPGVPVAVYCAAVVVYAVGQAIHLWAKATNRWFATVVRIQHDRGQLVCREGPYRFVRHPGYVGGLLFSLATPLILGSWIALLPQVLAVAALVVRTGLEDRTLRAELPGYQDYARSVRHRLGPLW